MLEYSKMLEAPVSGGPMQSNYLPCLLFLRPSAEASAWMVTHIILPLSTRAEQLPIPKWIPCRLPELTTLIATTRQHFTQVPQEKYSLLPFLCTYYKSSSMGKWSPRALGSSPISAICDNLPLWIIAINWRLSEDSVKAQKAVTTKAYH